MLSALQGLIPKRGVKRFGVHRGVKLKVCKATVLSDAFHLLHERRANTPASSFKNHVARSQFSVNNDQ
jgi:hypothetical protein